MHWVVITTLQYHELHHPYHIIYEEYQTVKTKINKWHKNFFLKEKTIMQNYMNTNIKITAT